jgi:hypothetical protein
LKRYPSAERANVEQAGMVPDNPPQSAPFEPCPSRHGNTSALCGFAPNGFVGAFDTAAR